MTAFPPAGTDAQHWDQAKRLRHEHPGWIVIWLAHLGQYRAYPLVHARRGTALTATTPADLADQITNAQHAARAQPGNSTG
jgi:hypothetical protein